MKDSDLENEAAVAADLGVKVIPSPGLPLWQWPDGFVAEISLLADEEMITVFFGPQKGADQETANRHLADFLRAVQRRAAEVGLGVLIEDQMRSEVSHVLDHLGFSISQWTVEDNEAWGEEFDDADFEWRPPKSG